MKGLKKRRVSFDHAGHSVSAFVKELDDQDATWTLNRLLSDSARDAGNYDPDLAQAAVLRLAVDDLKVDGRTYSLSKRNKGLPIYVDEETDKTTLEHLLGYVIRYNPVLVQRDRYRDAFEEFVLDEEDVYEADPTESLAE